MSSSSSSSSSSPPVVPQHCSTVSVLYELLKCEEEPCRVWLRDEMNQIPDPLIDSLFHALICSSSSSAVPQSRPTVSELCQQLQGEMGQLRVVLRGEMDRVVNTLTERLTNKLRMTNEDLDREEDDGGDRAQVGQVEQPNHHPSTSTFNSVSHQQHSNGDEVQLNTVEMIEIKEEVEDGEETRIIDMETLTQDRQVKREIKEEENEMTLHNDQIGDWVKREIKEEEEDGEMVEAKEEIKEEDEEEEEDGEMVEVKEEIKEEDEEEEEDGEMVEAKEEIKEEDEEEEEDGEIVEAKEEIKEEDEEEEEDGEMVEAKEEIKEEDEEEEEDGEIVEAKEEIKEEIKEEDEEEEDGEAQIDSIEGWAEENQSGDESQALDNVPLNTTLTHPTGQSQLTVTQSADLLTPQTSTAQDETNRTALDQQTTVPSRHKVTKRKQQTSKRSAKRSKPTIEEDEGDDGEDIANEDREESKVKTLNLNCTQSNCNVKLDSMVYLNDHLSTVHRLAPIQCFATNCNARFDSPRQIRDHIKLSHSQSTRFLCSVCPNEYGSQRKAYNHWYKNHQPGQFKCNLVSDCAQVTDTRAKMKTHQHTKHHTHSKNLHCTHPDCTASFVFKANLKQHQLTHLATNQFHCNWPHCSKQCKLRGNLVMHIRTKHFGLPKSVKAQKEKNIVDLRDPNEYVRVVVDE